MKRIVVILAMVILPSLSIAKSSVWKVTECQTIDWKFKKDAKYGDALVANQWVLSQCPQCKGFRLYTHPDLINVHAATYQDTEVLPTDEPGDKIYGMWFKFSNGIYTKVDCFLNRDDLSGVGEVPKYAVGEAAGIPSHANSDLHYLVYSEVFDKNVFKKLFSYPSHYETVITEMGEKLVWKQRWIGRFEEGVSDYTLQTMGEDIPDTARDFAIEGSYIYWREPVKVVKKKRVLVYDK